jgi:hypothetical protein
MASRLQTVSDNARPCVLDQDSVRLPNIRLPVVAKSEMVGGRVCLGGTLYATQCVSSDTGAAQCVWSDTVGDRVRRDRQSHVPVRDGRDWPVRACNVAVAVIARARRRRVTMLHRRP